LAVTVAFAVGVKRQVLVLLPPLEHAPDQTASRPFDTLSVIAVPDVNDAVPVLPTATLIPAGLDSTRSPLRPVAVTLTATVPLGGGGGGGGAACGVTVSVAVRLTPPNAAVRVTAVEVVTDFVVTVKFAVVAPAATVTLAGTVAADALLLASVTVAPPEGAALVKVTVPCEEFPPTTVAGLSASAESVGAVGGGGAVDCGVNLRTVDHAPATPDELTPRTRHHNLLTGSVLLVNCEALAVAFVIGDWKLLSSSICIR
jgi:hypothetical protein